MTRRTVGFSHLILAKAPLWPALARRGAGASAVEADADALPRVAAASRLEGVESSSTMPSGEGVGGLRQAAVRRADAGPQVPGALHPQTCRTLLGVATTSAGGSPSDPGVALAVTQTFPGSDPRCPVCPHGHIVKVERIAPLCGEFDRPRASGIPRERDRETAVQFPCSIVGLPSPSCTVSHPIQNISIVACEDRCRLAIAIHCEPKRRHLHLVGGRGHHPKPIVAGWIRSAEMYPKCSRRLVIQNAQCLRARLRTDSSSLGLTR